METREIPRLGTSVSVIGLGTWQLGADWGDVDPDAARETLEAARAAGVTFFDTADVYGDGRSEQFCGELKAEHPEVFVATKMGRRVEQTALNYNHENFLAWNRRSRENLGQTPLELVQLHCPPDAVFTDRRTYESLDDMVDHGLIAHYGVSVETCAQALEAIARPNVATVQIVMNCFRLKPLEQVLPAARQAGVGVIVRVPLASGLLTGRYDADTQFPADDHRNYNRSGGAFDVGETFAGVPFEVAWLPSGPARAGRRGHHAGSVRAALGDRPARREHGHPRSPQRGAGDPERVSGGTQPLRAAQRDGVQAIYDRHIRPHVHDRW